MSVGAVSEPAALDLYGAELVRAASLPLGSVGLRAVDEEGEELPLELERYLSQSAAEESGVLERAIGPVLDVGCGPARHVLELARRGVPAIGLDISPLAVGIARRRGALVIEASIFDRLPGAGHWGSALLLDGNIGIGGHAEDLLRRVGGLLRPGGLVLVEVETPGAPTRRLRMSLETGEARSQWFPWARVSVDQLDATAAAAGLQMIEQWQAGGRWFGALRAARRSTRALTAGACRA